VCSSDLRPEVTANTENTSVDFQIRQITGGGFVTDTVDVKTTSVNISLPLVIRFSSKNIAPYISLGPSFSYLFSQNTTSVDKLPIMKSLFMGGGGLGVDIGLGKSGFAISPELKYAAGFSDMKDHASITSYSNALSSLKKNVFSLNVYLRKR
jgi:hypothetical protein